MQLNQGKLQIKNKVKLKVLKRNYCIHSKFPKMGVHNIFFKIQMINLNSNIIKIKSRSEGEEKKLKFNLILSLKEINFY